MTELQRAVMVAFGVVAAGVAVLMGLAGVQAKRRRRASLRGRVLVPLSEWPRRYASYFRGLTAEQIVDGVRRIGAELCVDPCRLHPSDSLDGILATTPGWQDWGDGLAELHQLLDSKDVSPTVQNLIVHLARLPQFHSADD